MKVRTSLLVLVRWQGDVIATHTVEQGKKLQSFDFLQRDSGVSGFDARSSDVSVEMYDVAPERAALGRLAPKADLRAVYAFMASGALHAAFAIVALLGILTQGGERLEAPDANRRAATIQDDTQVAADEGADAGAVEPPKDDKERVPEEPTIDETDSRLAQAEQPTPPPPETAAPPEPPGAPAQEEGSEAPGSGGLDSITASPATCTKLTVPKTKGKMCTRSVTVTSMDAPASCFVDTVMKMGQTGTLSFPCSGDGEARLTFGNKSFKGASIGGKLEMCAGTEYPFSDGCRWTSAQRVTGRVALQSLSFSYGEAPKAGQNKQCASACSASGTVRVN